MVDKLKVKVSYAEVGKLLRSRELSAGLENMAYDIAHLADGGFDYDAEVKQMGTRVISSVFTATNAGMRDNAENNTLLKAVQRL